MGGFRASEREADAPVGRALVGRSATANKLAQYEGRRCFHWRICVARAGPLQLLLLLQVQLQCSHQSCAARRTGRSSCNVVQGCEVFPILLARSGVAYPASVRALAASVIVLRRQSIELAA